MRSAFLAIIGLAGINYIQATKSNTLRSKAAPFNKYEKVLYKEGNLF